MLIISPAGFMALNIGLRALFECRGVRTFEFFALAQALTLFDWIYAEEAFFSIVMSQVACVREGEGWKVAKSHFAQSASSSVAKNPGLCS